jgi:4-hydroxy-tetrahydrodipicolinate synthase
MNLEETKRKLAGVAVTPPTPFSEDGDSVLYDELRENVAYLVDAGIPVLLPCGNTGEYYSLSDDERVRIVEQTAAAAGDDAAVVAGAGGSTKHVLQLADRYREAGADGIMLMHPGHTYVHRDGLRRYFERIAAGTELGVVLYKRGPEVMDELLVDLTEIENVVGVKYAVNDVSAFSRAVERSSGDAVWSNGIAERFAPSFLFEGAKGFTSGIGAFVPELPLALMEALRNGEWARARQLRELARPYEELRDGTGPNSPFASANNVPAVKYGMELAGLYGGPVREPLTGLSEADEERAEALYREITERLPKLS